MADNPTTGVPHWHCINCHHEWDGRSDACDWCGAVGEVIGQYSWAIEAMRFIADVLKEKNDGR